MTTPLLTIAIPTYNRASILDSTLAHLIGDADFDSSRVEIVVSDNASTDNTAEIVAKYPGVLYHCNPENIGYRNFTVAMSLGRGQYIRLMNDTVRYRPGMLGKLLSIVEESLSLNAHLVICNPCPGLRSADMIVSGADELLHKIMHEITWVGNLGMWREDFQNLTNPDRLVGTLMQHVDWMLRVTEDGKKTRLVIDAFWDVYPVKQKGSYHLFDTFINQYLKILRTCGMGVRIVEREKYYLLRYFVLYWYFHLKKDKEYQFDMRGAWSVLWANYWYEPYFYFWMLFGYFRHWTRS